MLSLFLTSPTPTLTTTEKQKLDSLWSMMEISACKDWGVLKDRDRAPGSWEEGASLLSGPSQTMAVSDACLVNTKHLATFPRGFCSHWNGGSGARRRKNVSSLSFRPSLWRWQAWVSRFTGLKKTLLNINGKFWFYPKYCSKCFQALMLRGRPAIKPELGLGKDRRRHQQCVETVFIYNSRSYSRNMH